MKIDTNLRAAIRAAVKSHNNGVNISNDYAQRRKAAMEVAKMPKHKAQVVAAVAGLKKAHAEMDKHRKALRDLGLSESSRDMRTWSFDVGDESKFKRAGGVLPVRGRKLDFDRVLADLAAANEVAAKGILRSLNINWG